MARTPYSRFLNFEGQRLLQSFGAEVRIVHANDLPPPNDAPETHPKAQEFRGNAVVGGAAVHLSGAPKRNVGGDESPN
jgi:hypothetical protein